jgi:hypothetical protein
MQTQSSPPEGIARNGSPQKFRMGPCEFEAEGRYLTLRLRESNDVLGDTESLRARFETDGYLFIRGFHERNEVLGVRREILEIMATDGQLDPTAPREDGAINPEQQTQAGVSTRGRENLKTESLKRLLYGAKPMNFFRALFGAEALSYQFQWLRAGGHGAGSTIHSDVVYMGRGTKRLCTCWTPLGDIPPEMGPLVICLGSNQWRRIRDTYGQADVDRDLIPGHFTDNPSELVEKFGGRWATASMRGGDAVILNMFTLHASLTNMTNRYRISVDTRYQPANEPIDDRWAGDDPKGHTELWKPGVQLEPLTVSRNKWGV